MLGKFLNVRCDCSDYYRPSPGVYLRKLSFRNVSLLIAASPALACHLSTVNRTLLSPIPRRIRRECHLVWTGQGSGAAMAMRICRVAMHSRSPCFVWETKSSCLSTASYWHLHYLSTANRENLLICNLSGSTYFLKYVLRTEEGKMHYEGSRGHILAVEKVHLFALSLTFGSCLAQKTCLGP